MTAIVSEEDIRGTGKRKVLYGTIYTYDDGSKTYIARRKHREIFRNEQASISEAIGKGIAAWAIDEELLYKLRAKKVSMVGVGEIDTGDLYLAPISVWFNHKTSRMKDYTGIGKGGSRQRYVPLQHFTYTMGVVELDSGKLY